jgi:L-alanine-DL-glutamate epimerase-like enolase superfamily enzyme
MLITNVRAAYLNVPMKASAHAPVGGETSAHHTLIVIDTDGGLQGIGEAFRLAHRPMCAFIEDVLGPLLVGEDPRRIEYLWEKMYAATFRYGRAGLALHAISGVEIALWDILGKSLQTPVHQLLGGAMRLEIPAYASLHKFATPQAAAEIASHYAREGYHAIKLHQRDVASVEAARKALGDGVRLMVDAAGAWTAREALDACRAFAALGVHWVEEPLARMDDYDGLRWLRDRAGLRIAAGENEYTHWGFREMIERRAVDVVQPDVIKAGGLLACRRIAALADAFDHEISPHSFYYGPGIAATLQFCAATARTQSVEINPHPLESWFMDPPLRPENGTLPVPTAPGLGVTVDPERLARGMQWRRQ